MTTALLRLLAIAISLGNLYLFLMVLMALTRSTEGSSAASWYATIANLHVFTAVPMAVAPALLLLAPLMFLAERVWRHADALEEIAMIKRHQQERLQHNQNNLFVGDSAMLSPPTPAEPRSQAEKDESLRQRKEAQERTEAYLADYFGPNGPRTPVQRQLRRRRK